MTVRLMKPMTPLDPAENKDTDGDGTGNRTDSDDDGDGVPDSEDDYPLDPTKSNAADAMKMDGQ